MGLTKIKEESKLCSIDKVIAGGKGIEVNGIAYWFAKRTGQTCQYPVGQVVEMKYTHLKNEKNEDVYILQSLDLGNEQKEDQLDSIFDDDFKTKEDVNKKYVKEPSGGTTMTTDEKITNMNILNRAVDWAIATGNLEDKAVLEQCKVYKEMLFKF